MTGLVPSKREEVSLPRHLLPRASSLSLLLQFCSPWHGFPVESRSGPPSPHVALKEASPFPSPLGGLTFTGRVEEPKGPTPRRCHCSSWGQNESRPLSPVSPCSLTSTEKWAQSSHDSSQPPGVPTERGEEGDLERSFQSAKSFLLAWIMVNKE